MSIEVNNDHSAVLQSILRAGADAGWSGITAADLAKLHQMHKGEGFKTAETVSELVNPS